MNNSNYKKLTEISSKDESQFKMVVKAENELNLQYGKEAYEMKI